MKARQNGMAAGNLAEPSNDDFSERLERSFVELIAQRVEERGWTKTDFAVRVWPNSHKKAASSKWSDIRGKATHTGKPQGIRLAEAYRMAQVLGEDLVYLIAVAAENMKK